MAANNRKNRRSAPRAQYKRNQGRTLGTSVRKLGKERNKMSKRVMGRPARLYPPRVDATADELVGAMFSLSPEESAAIRKNPQQREYRCVDCKRLVGYPEVLYADDRCESCHKAA